MRSETRRLLQLGALVVPVIAAAAGGKWAVDATRLKTSSVVLPSPQELDALRGYVIRTAPAAVPPKPTIDAYAIGSDPFAKVARWETPKYSTAQGVAPSSPVPPRWVVSTIMITETRRVAVINGVLVSPGSVLPGGARILAIEPDHVVLTDAGGARREISVSGGTS